MEWFVLALLGALFNATYFMLIKKFLKTVNQHVLAAGAFLSSSLILIFVSMVRGFPALGSQFYTALLATTILNIVAAVLYYKALSITDLSLSIPMISFTPVFLIFTSLLLLKELPTAFGIVGIFLIVFGSYILNLSKGSSKLLEPFREMFRNKGILYMLAVALLFSFTANFDKIMVRNSDAFFGSAMFFLLMGLAFSFISLFKIKSRLLVKKDIYKLILPGVVLALEAIMINTAYFTQIVPYVISIKRLSILFSVLYGGWLFREGNIFKRILGAAIMLVGVVLIILL